MNINRDKDGLETQKKEYGNSVQDIFDPHIIEKITQLRKHCILLEAVVMLTFLKLYFLYTKRHNDTLTSS